MFDMKDSSVGVEGRFGCGRRERTVWLDQKGAVDTGCKNTESGTFYLRKD